MKRKYEYFYRRNKLKQVSGYLSATDREALKEMAKAADKSLTRYVTRLLERHIRTEAAKPPIPLLGTPRSEKTGPQRQN